MSAFELIPGGAVSPLTFFTASLGAWDVPVADATGGGTLPDGSVIGADPPDGAPDEPVGIPGALGVAGGTLGELDGADAVIVAAGAVAVADVGADDEATEAPSGPDVEHPAPTSPARQRRGRSVFMA